MPSSANWWSSATTAFVGHGVMFSPISLHRLTPPGAISEMERTEIATPSPSLECYHPSGHHLRQCGFFFHRGRRRCDKRYFPYPGLRWEPPRPCFAKSKANQQNHESPIVDLYAQYLDIKKDVDSGHRKPPSKAPPIIAGPQYDLKRNLPAVIGIGHVNRLR